MLKKTYVFDGYDTENLRLYTTAIIPFLLWKVHVFITVLALLFKITNLVRKFVHATGTVYFFLDFIA